MPLPPDKASDPLAGLPDLPNPELNPLLNPILGRHLGRWAQVYFTTPSERRDEAIYDLLHELKAEEEAGTGDAENAPSGAPDPTVLICARCNHHHTRLQNFCGMCGAPLLPGMTAEPEPRITEVPEPAVTETILTEPVPPARTAPEPIYSRAPESRIPVEQRFGDEQRFGEGDTQELNLEGLLTPGLLFDPRQSGSERREAAREREMPRATTQSMIYADDPPAAISEPLPSFREQRPERRPVAREADVDWLRDRQFGQEIGRESSGAWKVVVVLGLLMVLGALVYFRLEILRPLRSAISPTAPQTSAQPQSSAPSAQTPAPEPIPEEPEANTATAHPNAAVPPAKPSSQPNRAPSAPAVSQRSDRSAGKIQSVGAAENPPATLAAGAPQSGAEIDTGTGELALAEKLLSGSSGARNSAAAASLLWKAVGKQNTTAILLLSDLYATGDGVPKSCDQARLLLDAALRKGTAGAANRLQNLQRSCR